MQQPASISLHHLIRGLIESQGLSIQAMVIRSGVNPGTIAALSARIPKHIMTWMRFLSAYQCRLEITAQGKTWQVALPRIPQSLREREIRTWKLRRYNASLMHLVYAGSRRSDAEKQARQYADNGASRLHERRREILAKSRHVTGGRQPVGLRDAIALLVQATQTTGEELSVISGNSLASCQLMLQADDDGRLATVHRILSALSARIRILTVGGTTLEIPQCDPGQCLPFRAPPVSSAKRTAPKKSDVRNRSHMPADKILHLYDRGHSIGVIARQAGISRQRVDRIAKVNGRPSRRAAQRINKIKSGNKALGISGREKT